MFHDQDGNGHITYLAGQQEQMGRAASEADPHPFQDA